MAKKRTKAQRRAAALASWERRKQGLGPLWKRGGKKGKARTQPVPTNLVSVEDPGLLGPLADGYDTLAYELTQAYAQSAAGKGKERHANGRPFDRQPILELARMYGPGFTAGQAAKKAQEALGMAGRGERDKAIHELHGAIVYLAATVVRLREG